MLISQEIIPQSLPILLIDTEYQIKNHHKHEEEAEEGEETKCEFSLREPSLDAA